MSFYSENLISKNWKRPSGGGSRRKRKKRRKKTKMKTKTLSTVTDQLVGPFLRGEGSCKVVVSFLGLFEKCTDGY